MFPNLIKSDFSMPVSCCQVPEFLPPPCGLTPSYPDLASGRGLEEVLLSCCTSLTVKTSPFATAMWIYTPTMSCRKKSNFATRSLKAGLGRRRIAPFIFGWARFLGPGRPKRDKPSPSPEIDSSNCCAVPSMNECVCFCAWGGRRPHPKKKPSEEDTTTITCARHVYLKTNTANTLRKSGEQFAETDFK